MTELADAQGGLKVLEQAVSSIREEHLHDPTPCRDYDVAALAAHLVDSLTRISAAAGVVVGAPTGAPIAGMIEAGRDAIAGWRRRGTDGDVSFAGRTMAARDLPGVIGLEFVVHGWDFATAVGDTLTVPDALARDVLRVAHRTVTPHSRRHAGFDEPVAIDTHASALDRLVAFTGRDPAWTPLR